MTGWVEVGGCWGGGEPGMWCPEWEGSSMLRAPYEDTPVLLRHSGGRNATGFPLHALAWQCPGPHLLSPSRQAPSYHALQA
jgi:hypothetical protein